MKGTSSSKPDPAPVKTPPDSSNGKQGIAKAIDYYHWDAHHRLTLSCSVAGVAILLMHGHLAITTQLVVAWNAFALSNVVLAWIVICCLDPYEVRRDAALQDSSRTLAFILVIGGASASIFAVWYLISIAKGLPRDLFVIHLAASVIAILLSWVLVHTIFTLRYAHRYYFHAKSQTKEQISGGLIFPGDDDPDFLDFAYFAFVIGMTSQVSDVQISCHQIRRLALLHGVLSFGFNTAILATFVNIVAGLI